MPKTLTRERQQFLFDVFVTALEGGINYWSHCLTYKWIKDGADPDGEMDEITDLEGFYAEIVDDADDAEGSGKAYRIDAKVIQKGLGVVRRMTDDPLTGSSSEGLHKTYRGLVLVADHQNDASDIDALLADAIVQCGLFGQVIYG